MSSSSFENVGVLGDRSTTRRVVGAGAGTGDKGDPTDTGGIDSGARREVDVEVGAGVGFGSSTVVFCNQFKWGGDENHSIA